MGDSSIDIGADEFSWWRNKPFVQGLSPSDTTTFSRFLFSNRFIDLHYFPGCLAHSRLFQLTFPNQVGIPHIPIETSDFLFGGGPISVDRNDLILPGVWRFVFNLS